MYKAKTNGKGHFQVFHPSMGEAVLERHGLKEELRLAIERQELTLYFQPIIDLATGALVAEEALVRWQHPRRGLVGPSEFVPLAEETGLILSLGQYVLEEACQQARRGRPAAPVGPAGGAQSPSTSTSARSSSATPRWSTACARRSSNAGVHPRSVVFEITESVLLDDSERVKTTIAELRALGVQVRARRLRDRLLVAQLPAHAAVRHAEDRQVVRRRPRPRRPRGVVRAHDHRARPHARAWR